MLLAIQTPATNELGPIQTEQLLSAIHQANVDRLPVTFAYGTHDGIVRLYCRADPRHERMLEEQLLGLYPDCSVTRLDEDALACPDTFVRFTCELQLQPDMAWPF